MEAKILVLAPANLIYTIISDFDVWYWFYP